MTYDSEQQKSGKLAKLRLRVGNRVGNKKMAKRERA
jgi:hypothetical protein